MNIIGITGSSGTGKSKVCEIFESEYNVKIINADKVARKLSEENRNYLKEIVQHFGNNILDNEDKLDRKKLSQIIYNNSEKREELNKCTFKYIVEEIENQISSEESISTIIIDAPLLFESKLNEICNTVIGVISNKNLQIQRIKSRDNINSDEAEKRINSQKSNEFYIEKCNEIIQNDGDIENIKEKIEIIAEKCNITKKLQ